MADEFMKGFALFSIGGLGWLIFGGWYRTPEYYTFVQLVVDAPAPETIYDTIGILASTVFFWLMIVGALTFWVVIPLTRQLRESLAEGNAS